MTNMEIVISEAIGNGIFTDDQIQGFLSESGDIPLKTYKSWQEAGYVVRRGQKARLQTKLWQLKPMKKDDESSQEQSEKERFILVPAYLFTFDQVAKIGE